MTSRRCIFAGPSLYGMPIPPSVDVYGPASLGSVFRAHTLGYRVIGLIDGLFGSVPTVWHKEILHVINEGTMVAGAASIGALRSSELDMHGMIGIGAIYRLYRRGSILDDDEVCVLHGPKYVQFAPATLAMIDIRITLRMLRRRCIISADHEDTISEAMKALHFSQRSYEALGQCVSDALKSKKYGARYIESRFVSIKQRDAALLLNIIAKDRIPSSSSKCHHIHTNNWKKVIVDERDLIPPLERWPTSPARRG